MKFKLYLFLFILLFTLSSCITSTEPVNEKPITSVCGDGIIENGENEQNCCEDFDSCSIDECVDGRNCENDNLDVKTNNSLKLSPIGFHEDTAVNVTLTLSATQMNKYSSLQIILLQGESDVDGNSLTEVKEGSHSTVFANLNPNTNYRACLTGFNTDFTSTGYFDCVDFTTGTKQLTENAMIILDATTSNNLFDEFSDWLALVRNENPQITIEVVNLDGTEDVTDIYSIVQDAYQTSNLRTLLLIGKDIPLPSIYSEWEKEINTNLHLYRNPSTNMAKSSYDYTNNNEILISVMRPEDQNELINYFRRNIDYRNAPANINKKYLLADGMVDIERLDRSKFTDISQIETIDGITSYDDFTEAYTWKDEFTSRLNGAKYDAVLLNVHGAQEFHYPCSDGCIDNQFINNALDSNSVFLISITCNIGYQGFEAPAARYVYDGDFLSVITSETPYYDTDSDSVTIFNSVMAKSSIGNAARGKGMIIIGDPFLTLN